MKDSPPKRSHSIEEGRRLRILRHHDILDTPAEGSFDRIVALAADLLDAPMAVIGFVDAGRIWFKARHGVEQSQVGIDAGLYASDVLHDDALIVEDIRSNAGSPRTPFIARSLATPFYAGVPIRTRCGQTLGLLCVLDRERRCVETKAVSRLEHLGAMVMDHLEHRLAARTARAEADVLARQRELALQLTEGEARRRATAEAELRRSEFRFRQWAEMSSDIRWEMDAQFRITIVEGTALPGWLSDPLGRGPWGPAGPETDGAWSQHPVADLRAGVAFKDVDIPIAVPSSRDSLWIRCSGRPIHAADGRLEGFVGVTTDVTQSKRADRELRIKAGQQQGLALLGQIALQDGAIEDLFSVACGILVDVLAVSAAAVILPTSTGDGLKVRASAGHLPLLSHPGTIPIARDSLAGTAFLSADPVTVIDAEVEVSIWRTRYGSPWGIHSGMAVGIGERSRRFGVISGYSTEPRTFNNDETTFLQSVAFVIGAAMERRDSVASLRLRDRALEAVGQGIAIADAMAADAPIVYVNRALEHTTGFSAAQLKGRPVNALLGEARFDREIVPALEAEGSFSGQAVATRRNGSTFAEEVTVSKVLDEFGRTTHYVSTHADLTQRQRLEAELREAQKMDALGKLTGGVAHDFNNLLTVILGNAEVLAQATTDPTLKSLAHMIVEAADRGADTVQRLLSFGRRQALQPENVDINAVIEGLASLFHRSIGEDIVLRRRPSRMNVFSYVDKPQLETAILNLVVNARDAMPRGGVITIETDLCWFGEQNAPAGLDPGPYVVIHVIDTGCGMSQDVVDNAFEPFFTTKDVGKGTGLGLSMVYGFVRQSGGHIQMVSEVGKGTTVRILLPYTDKADAPAVTNRSGELQMGDERVLVVEDQDDVRDFVSAQLVSFGYRVTAVSNAREAIERIQEDEGFDLLFTDIIMPGGIDGIELADRALRLRPTLKILFTSGYSDRAVERQSHFQDVGASLLKKPYRRSELAQAIRAAITKRSHMRDQDRSPSRH